MKIKSTHTRSYRLHQSNILRGEPRTAETLALSNRERQRTTNASSSSIPGNTLNLEAITTGTVEALCDMDKIVKFCRESTTSVRFGNERVEDLSGTLRNPRAGPFQGS